MNNLSQIIERIELAAASSDQCKKMHLQTCDCLRCKMMKKYQSYLLPPTDLLMYKNGSILMMELGELGTLIDVIKCMYRPVNSSSLGNLPHRDSKSKAFKPNKLFVPTVDMELLVAYLTIQVTVIILNLHILFNTYDLDVEGVEVSALT